MKLDCAEVKIEIKQEVDEFEKNSETPFQIDIKVEDICDSSNESTLNHEGISSENLNRTCSSRRLVVLDTDKSQDNQISNIQVESEKVSGKKSHISVIFR